MAGKNFYLADPHLWHKGIITSCRRPWDSAAKMTNDLLNNINECCDERDTLYWLGDIMLGVSCEKLRAFMARVRCQRNILIMGNHEEMHAFTYIKCGFESAHTSLEVNGRILVHDPAVAPVKPDRTFVCGHVHTLFLKCNNAINVGMDMHNFKPISEEVIEQLERNENHSILSWNDLNGR